MSDQEVKDILDSIKESFLFVGVFLIFATAVAFPIGSLGAMFVKPLEGTLFFIGSSIYSYLVFKYYFFKKSNSCNKKEKEKE